MGLLDEYDETDCPQRHTQRVADVWLFGDDHQELGYVVKGDGRVSYRTRCSVCRFETRDIAHERATASGREVIWSRAKGVIDYPECEVSGCGRSGVDRHHWAPVNVFTFDVAETWPTSRLCKEHHQEWHRRMDGYRWSAVTITLPRAS